MVRGEHRCTMWWMQNNDDEEGSGLRWSPGLRLGVAAPTPARADVENNENH